MTRAAPHRYQWPDGKRCAVVFSADVDAESPFLWNNRGRPITTLGELEQRRFGPRVGVWRMLDLLDEFGAKASFYVPGIVAETYPELLPAFLARGHEIGLHGYHHERVDQVGEAENADILDRSIALFRAQTGEAPVGYRSPSWEMTPALFDLLKVRGIAYDSSLMGYDHPYTIGGLTEVPVQWLIDDAIYFKFVGGGADRWPPVNPADVLDSWLEEWRAVRDYGGLFMITTHPWISGRGQRIRLLRELFRQISADSGVWWTTAREIAAYHAASQNAARFETPIQLANTKF